MKNKVPFLILFCTLVFTKFTFSQEKHTLGHNEFFMMHYYTFEGALDQSKIDALEQNLLNLQFVSQAKVKYKPEKNMGQIVLVVKEKTVTSEGDQVFSPTSVKQTILSNGLTPMEYTTGKYESK
jgi:hypothetical protein